MPRFEPCEPSCKVVTIEAMLSTPGGSTFVAVQLAAHCCALTLWQCADANGIALTLSRQHGITPSPEKNVSLIADCYLPARCEY